MMADEQIKYFVTDDTSLAAYLHLKGMKAMEATIYNPENRRRKSFIFIDSPLREGYEEEFYNRTAVCAPLDYFDARVTISRYLKNTVEDPRKMVN